MISKDKYYSINCMFQAIFLFSIIIYGYINIFLNIPPNYFPYLFIIYGLYMLISAIYFKKTMLAYVGNASGDYAYLFWGIMYFLISLMIAIRILQAKYQFGESYFWIAIFLIIIVPIFIVWIKYKLNKRKRKEIPIWRLPWE